MWFVALLVVLVIMSHVNSDACGNRCGANSTCLTNSDGSTGKCACVAGTFKNGTKCEQNDCTKMSRNLNEICSLSPSGTCTCDCNVTFVRNNYGVCVQEVCQIRPSVCPQHSQCYQHADGAHSCHCHSDRVMIGDACVLHPCSPSSKNNCALNAQCVRVRSSSPLEYECKCPPGYFGDGVHACKPDICTANPTLCAAPKSCVSDKSGDFECQCPLSMFDNESGGCETKPCYSSTHTCDTDREVCMPDTKNPRDYACICKSPFVRNANGTLGGHRCVRDSTLPCIPGEFTCPITRTCIPLEHVLDKLIDCADGEDEMLEFVDRCALGMHDCHEMAQCRRTFSNHPEHRGYECVCKEGYSGDGFICIDLRNIQLGVNLETDVDKQIPKRQFDVATNTDGPPPLILQLRVPTPQLVVKVAADNLTVPRRVDQACLSNKYQCQSDPSICLPVSGIFNNVIDCPDGDDEDPRIILTTSEPCALGMHMCDMNHGKCVHDRQSGTYTCGCDDGFVGETGVICRTTAEMALVVSPVDKSPKFANHYDFFMRLPGGCARGTANMFDCGEKCIDVSKFRDGVQDCNDGSDEWCFQDQSICGDKCVRSVDYDSKMCDLQKGCSNKEDADRPAFCKLSKSKLCSSSSIATVPCRGYGECIMHKWLMDGKADCIDRSDEDPTYATEMMARTKDLSGSTGNGGSDVTRPPGNTVLPGVPPIRTNAPWITGAYTTGASWPWDGTYTTVSTSTSTTSTSTSPSPRTSTNTMFISTTTTQSPTTIRVLLPTLITARTVPPSRTTVSRQPDRTVTFPDNQAPNGETIAQTSYVGTVGTNPNLITTTTRRGPTTTPSENQQKRCFERAVQKANSGVGNLGVCDTECKGGISVKGTEECGKALVMHAELRATKLCNAEIPFRAGLADTATPIFNEYAMVIADNMRLVLSSVLSPLSAMCVFPSGMSGGPVVFHAKFSCDNIGGCTSDSVRRLLQQQDHTNDILFDPDYVTVLDPCTGMLHDCAPEAMCNRDGGTYRCACQAGLVDPQLSSGAQLAGRKCVVPQATTETAVTDARGDVVVAGLCTDFEIIGICIPQIAIIIAGLIGLLLLLLLLCALWQFCCKDNCCVMEDSDDEEERLREPHDQKKNASKPKKKSSKKSTTTTAATSAASTARDDLDRLPPINARQPSANETQIEPQMMTRRAVDTPTIWETYKKFAVDRVRQASAKGRAFIRRQSSHGSTLEPPTTSKRTGSDRPPAMGKLSFRRKRQRSVFTAESRQGSVTSNNSRTKIITAERHSVTSSNIRHVPSVSQSIAYVHHPPTTAVDLNEKRDPFEEWRQKLHEDENPSTRDELQNSLNYVHRHSRIPRLNALHEPQSEQN